MLEMIIGLMIVTALWCNAITFLSEKGEPLYFLHRWMEYNLPSIMAKPFLLCVTCMASVHTLIVMSIYGWMADCLTHTYFKQYLLIAPGASFLSGIFYLVRIILEKIFHYVKKSL